jgi:hypothetical protein
MDVAQGTPGTPAETGRDAVEAVLKSRTWEARLAEARARRDKLLADSPRGVDAVVPPRLRPWERPARAQDRVAEDRAARLTEGLIATLPPERRRAVEERLSRAADTGLSTGTPADGERAAHDGLAAGGVQALRDEAAKSGAGPERAQPRPPRAEDRARAAEEARGPLVDAIRLATAGPAVQASQTALSGPGPSPASVARSDAAPRGVPGHGGDASAADGADGAEGSAGRSAAFRSVHRASRGTGLPTPASDPASTPAATQAAPPAADAMTRAIRALSTSAPSGAAAHPSPSRTAEERTSGPGPSGDSGEVVVHLSRRRDAALAPVLLPATARDKAADTVATRFEPASAEQIGVGAEVFRGFSAGTMIGPNDRVLPAARPVRITPLAIVLGFAVGLGLGFGLTFALRLAPALLPAATGVAATSAPQEEPRVAAAPPLASMGPGPAVTVPSQGGPVLLPMLDAEMAVAISRAAADMSPRLSGGQGALALPLAVNGDPAPLAPDPAPPVAGRGPFALASLRAMPGVADPAADPSATKDLGRSAISVVPARSAEPAPSPSEGLVQGRLAAPGEADAVPAARQAVLSRPVQAATPVAPAAGRLAEGMGVPTLPGGPGRPVARPARPVGASLSAPLARPAEPDLAPARQTAAPVPAFAGVQLRLVVPQGLPDDQTQAAEERLATAGFAAPDRRRTDVAIKGDQVRFYTPADRPAATAAAEALGAKLRDFSGSGADMPAGVIEVWLRGTGPKAATATKKPARAKPAKAAQPAPATDPLAQALRDKIIAGLRARKP